MINNLSEFEKKKYAFKYVFSKYLMEIFKVFSYLTVFVVSYLTMFVVLCYGVYEGFTFLMNKYSIDPVFLKSSVVFSIFSFIFMIYVYIKIHDNVNYFKEIIFENQWVKNTGEAPLGKCFNVQYKDGTVKIKVDKRKLDFNLNKNNPIVYYSLFSTRKSPWLVNNGVAPKYEFVRVVYEDGSISCNRKTKELNFSLDMKNAIQYYVKEK